MDTVLITGANRGIGLEFVKQYLADGWKVLATCRDPQSAKDLGNLTAKNSSLTVFALDVTSQEQINGLADQLSDVDIDLLINNAGYYGSKGSSFGSIDRAEWLRVLEINTLAPLFIAEAFVENVARSNKKLMALLSSKVGSVADNTSGGSYLYRTSKSALNQIVKSLSIDLAERGINVVSLHPGWVQTDMGGPNALIGVEESVKGLRNVLDDFPAESSGSFLAYDGQEIPW